jgi:riboflavin kinase/FMN adenylyltransferase
MKRVLAIGVFDGVHVGHRAMLDLARSIAVGRDLSVCAVTFDPHPRAVVAPPPPPLLCSVERRLELLRAAGADRIEIIHFDKDVASVGPTRFVDEWIADRYDAAAVVVGQNFRYGRAAAGTYETLKEDCAKHGIDVATCPMLQVEGQVVSSTRVRSLIGDHGDVAAAAQLLTAPFQVAGEVVVGAKRGRELGMPTANLLIDSALLVPRDGVYGGWATVRGERWPAAISVGTNPQFTSGDPDAPRVVEAHLIGFDDDIYGEELSVTFELHVRAQGIFRSVEDLVERMNQDVREVAAAL